MAFLLSAAAEMAMWKTLPAMARVLEPWDDTGLYSIGVVFGVGLCIGFLLPFHSVAVWGGATAGSLLYSVLFTRAGELMRWLPLALLRIAMDATWAFPACCGSFVGSWLRVLATGKRGLDFTVETIRHWPDKS